MKHENAGMHRSLTTPMRIVVAAVLSMVSLLEAAGASEALTHIEARYTNLSRTYEVVFAGGYGHGSQVSPLRPTERQKREFRERLGYVLRDCSDATYHCLSYQSSVFAVPRTALKAGMAYVVGGVRLSVEECIREGQLSCQVALISSDCQVIRESQRCELGSSERSKDLESGVVTYFLFNEDFGVTAFGKANGWIESRDERIQLANEVVDQLVLQSERGLLGDHVAERP